VSRAWRDEAGVALVAVLAVSSVLLALGLSLALTTSIETGIAANQRGGVRALHAADAALEHAIAVLGTVADWDAVLTGVARSPFNDGAGAVRLPVGGVLELGAETNLLRCGRAAACDAAAMDASTAARPWGRNNPRWVVFASGPLARLLPDDQVKAREYVVVWAADDPSENDASPQRDGGVPARVDASNADNPGRGAIWLRARAYGTQGAVRTVDAIVERDPRFPAVPVHVRVWRALS
jgi:hypothetical protein